MGVLAGCQAASLQVHRQGGQGFSRLPYRLNNGHRPQALQAQGRVKVKRAGHGLAFEELAGGWVRCWQTAVPSGYRWC